MVYSMLLFFSTPPIPLTIITTCVTNMAIRQAFSSWSNGGRLRFDQHLVKLLTFDFLLISGISPPSLYIS